MQKLNDMEEDMINFKELWIELDKAWKNVEEIKDSLVSSL